MRWNRACCPSREVGWKEAGARSYSTDASMPHSFLSQFYVWEEERSHLHGLCHTQIPIAALSEETFDPPCNADD